MPHVWRIENELGEGPYRHVSDYEDSAAHYALQDWGTSTDRRPTPNRDPLLRGKWGNRGWGEVAFGFASLTQYKKWFRAKERDRLAEFNDGEFQLVKYKVPTAARKVGERQAVFDKSSAEVVANFAPNAV